MPETDAVVSCEFCGAEGRFVADGFEQVIIRFERNTDWNGDFANACSDCARSYRSGRSLQTLDGRIGVTPGERRRVALCYFHANDDPLFKVYLLGKPHYGEGARWIETDRAREYEKKLKQQLEEEFFERHGKTIKEWEEEKVTEDVVAGRIVPALAGRIFSRLKIED